MTNQRIKSSIIITIIALGIGLAFGYFYTKYIPTGILWRDGISKNDVMLLTDSNGFRYYFINENGKPAGIMTLQKRGSFWSKYYYSQDISIANTTPNVTLIKSYQPAYKDNIVDAIPVWGGSVSDNKNEYQSVKIGTKGDIKDPTSIVKKEGNIYFFFIDSNMTTDDDIEILPQE